MSPAYFPEPIMVQQPPIPFLTIVGASVFVIAMVAAIFAAIYDVSIKYSDKKKNTLLQEDRIVVEPIPEASPKQRRSLTWGDGNGTSSTVSHQGMMEDAWFVNDTASAASDSQKYSDDIESASSGASDSQKEPMYDNLEKRPPSCDHHPDDLSEDHKTAILLACQGKYGESVVFYEQALRGYEHQLGSDHHRTINTMHSLAELLTEQGHYVRAKEQYLRLHSLSMKAVGEEHSDTMEIVHCLANLLHLQGKLVEAKGFYERVLRAREETFGPLDMLTLR